MANVIFRPFNDNFDIEDVRTALAFLWESSQVDEIGTDTIITIRYIGTTYEELADIYVEFYGDFTADDIEDWQIDRVEMGQGSEVVLTLDDLSLNGAEVGTQDGDNLLGFLMSGNDTITTETNFTDAVVEGYDGDDGFAMTAPGMHVTGGRGQDTALFDFGVRSATIQAETVVPEGETQEFHILRVTDRDDTEFTLYDVEAAEFDGERYEITGGSADNDLLTGTHSTRDLIVGGDGDDRINGLSGTDRLFGEAGNDTVTGGLGRDVIYAGSGNDELRGNGGNDFIHGQSGSDLLTGHRGSDRLLGGSGHDVLRGNKGRDTLSGGAGDDTLDGGLHDDLLIGGSGTDRLQGRRGNDRLLGQRGDDTLSGGSGEDTFIFARNHGNDVITDFAAGRDQIEIRGSANGIDELDFEAQDDDVLVSVYNVTILVEDITVEALQDADNFLF